MAMPYAFTARQRWLMGAVLVGILSCGCSSPLRRNWEAYRKAKKAGDYETAAKYLHKDARIWFGKKEGDGAPLRPRGGPYKDWDKEFRSTSVREDVRVEGRTLTYVSCENNDFFRLIDATPTKARVTYYFDDDDKITGMLYAPLAPRKDHPPDRLGAFKKWAAKKYPGLLDSEDMKIPNQPKRWRELLVEWREDVGLSPIDD